MVNPVTATITKVENYKALAMPTDPASAPPAVRLGVWSPAKDFTVGDKVTLHWYSNPSRGLWYPVHA